MSYRLNPPGLQLVSYFVRSLIFSLLILPNPHAASIVSEPASVARSWPYSYGRLGILRRNGEAQKALLHRGLERRAAASRGPVTRRPSVTAEMSSSKVGTFAQ